MASVKDHVLSCLQAFGVLSAAISAAEEAGDADEQDDDLPDDTRPQAFPLATVSDHLARFKIWAGNIGAHRKGRSSLDYRLREASHIRAQVVRLLGDLLEALQDGELLSPCKRPSHRLTDWSHLDLPRGSCTVGQGVCATGRK